MMGRIAGWLVFLAVLGGFTYVFRDVMRDGAQQIYRLALPCTIPITYKIGSIDPKFGISKQVVENDLKTASELWNDAARRKLIAHDQIHGDITVDLVYDSRQEMTQRLKALGLEITTDRQSYEIAKAKYDRMFADYRAAKKVFESNLAAFNAEKAAYEKQVAYWNDRGGAPRDEYLKLQMQQTNITSKSVTLMHEQNALNATARDVNNLAQTLNKLVAILNIQVERYNETGDENGETFEQGLYQREMGLETITIFEYENNALLIRVLAHELGHALGMDHVDDEDAVMYQINQGEAIALTEADKTELKRICRM